MTKELWKDDLLGFEDVGKAFCQFVGSIDDTKVVSIEAGYGRGKTYFRERWAKQLEQQGEVVVQIDAHMSDHAGDPLITFLGAMIEALPESEKSTGKKLVEKSRAFGGLAARSALRVLLRQGAEELIDFATDNAVDAMGESEAAYKDAAKDFGDGISKAAGDLVVSQIAAENLRKVEIPKQLDALREALTSEADGNRVVVIVDELDRCRPDYAIAFLEAMKLVFSREGYVFFLMVNSDYLEGLAANMFGVPNERESYLDKFVDIRLKLPSDEETRAFAARQLFSDLPLQTPFGEADAFSVEAAADLAGRIVEQNELSMRQQKRVKLKVELALRVYGDRPLDCPLLVFLAFSDVISRNSGEILNVDVYLKRARLTPGIKNKFRADRGSFGQEREIAARAWKFLNENCVELTELPDDRYRSPDPGRGARWEDWVPTIKHLSQFYLPEHKRVLDGVMLYEVGS